MRVCKPTILDIKTMQEIVKPYIDDAKILRRDDNEIANTIRSYTLIKTDDKIVGFGALHIYSTKLSEIRSLVVDKKSQNQGVGKKIINELINEAKKLNLKEILALTYEVDFFKKQGFIEVRKDEVPEHKVWEDCIKCKLFPQCDEIAMMIKL